ncbi:amidohydrolase family protein [Streptomyces sp. NPDC101455]|uniref:amidohydrolase family protein n=1 Tax=Streptomyces sp. NPDC101455 TaxID=3366142 RepID=UPI0037F8A57A
MTDHGADLVIRANAIHTRVPGQAPQRALAVRGDRIVALSPDPNGLDHLLSGRTTVHDLPGATVLPAFDDTHTHLIYAALGAHDVPVHQAHDIPEFLDLIRQRAKVTPEGEWIRTTTDWQELNLAERRMPTASELDQATDRHHVLVKRGGHNDIVNSYALRLAGITEDTPVPPGGVIGRDADGKLNGRLVDNALGLVERLVPAPDRAQRIDGLRLASAQYAATGIGAVRDCAVTPEDYAVLLAAREAGALNTRVRALISALGMTTRQTVIGVKGPEHAISYDEALTLHTVNAARLCGDQDLRGTLAPGRLADLTVWDRDPADCPSDALRDLNPLHTIVGGRLVTR